MVSAMKCGRPKNHRYKGIEGFLRRFAFNLGNSPSQTEVKIISCIPIDVTDLQEKIVCLERQVEQLQGRVCRSQTVCPVKVNGTKFRMLYQSNESADAPPNTISINPTLCPPVNDTYNEYETSVVPQGLASHLNATQAPETPPCAQGTALAEARHGKAIPQRVRTHQVYYAQTATGSPFTKYAKVNTNKREKLEETIDRIYLSSIIKRQYKSEEMCEGLSQVSAPVCRDVAHGDRSEDMCSCCQGHFLDLDHTTHRQITAKSVSEQNGDSGNIYYDSNFYDMKPVKEKSNKINEVTKKTASESDLTFCPEYYPFKPEYSLKTNCLASQSRYGTKSVKVPKRKNNKYHTQQIFLQNDSSQTDGCVEFSHVYTKRLSPKCKTRNAKCMVQIESNIGYMDSKLIKTLTLTKLVSTPDVNKPVSENYESVDQTINNTKCAMGPAKALQTVSMSELRSTHTGLNKAKFKNAECLAVPTNETECQTSPSKGAQSELLSPELEPNKTDTTLEQIKSILQTVLTEVKINSRMQAIEEGKEAKDNIAQKASVPSPDCERFLGSFTYSPFAMNNPYQHMASCSRYIPSYCSSLMRQTLTMPPQPTDLNCVQNFPVFVHRTLATQACCPERGTLMQPKQTSTNTLQEPPKKRTPETENLIKEIYKSIALPVDCPIQTTPRAALDEEKSINKVPLSEFRTADTMTQGRDEIIFRGDVGTSRREIRMMENHSNHSNINTRLSRLGGSFDQRPRIVTSAMRRRSYFNKPGDGPEPKETLAESASEAEHDVAQPPSTPKGSQKGFFGKVMSSVLKRMRRKSERQPQQEKRRTAIAYDSESSDGDTLVSRRRKTVKHVSYAPDHQPYTRARQSAGPVVSTSYTRRLDRLNRSSHREQGLRGDTPLHSPPLHSPPLHSPPLHSPPYHSPLLHSPPHHSLPHHSPPHQPPPHHSPPYLTPRHHPPPHHSPQMPRYAPRSALRPTPGMPPVARDAPRPPQPFPRSPPHEYVPRHHQYDARPSSPIDDFRPKPRYKNQGLKLTNKSWMQKPVYHLGFVCGPEKRKIMMQH